MSVVFFVDCFVCCLRLLLFWFERLILSVRAQAGSGCDEGCLSRSGLALSLLVARRLSFRMRKRAVRMEVPELRRLAFAMRLERRKS